MWSGSGFFCYCPSYIVIWYPHCLTKYRSGSRGLALWRWLKLFCYPLVISPSFSLNWLGSFGWSIFVITTTVVLSLCPIRSSAGLYPFSNRVKWYTKSATSGLSFHSTVFKQFLTAWRACLASPFACRKLGLLVVCSKSYSSKNYWNSWEENCGPLSDTKLSEIPYSIKAIFNFWITPLKLVILSDVISV